MSALDTQDYKSPLRKLVNFFENSRNNWKQKAIEAKKTVKRLSNRVRYLEDNRELWKQKAITAEKELKQLRLTLKKKENEREEFKKKRIEPNGKPKMIKTFEIVPYHHPYSIGHIMLYLSLVLWASISLRGASRALEVMITSFKLSLPVTSMYTARLWLLRFGS